MSRLFRETLVLNWPAILPPRIPAPTVLWFSTVKRNGREHPVCVSLSTDVMRGVQIYAHGTEAIVSGSCAMVGKTLFVGALSIAATSSTPVVAILDSLPAYHSSVWPGLLCGGVVSSPALAVTQPDMAIVDITFQRQEVDAPVEIRCRVIPRANGRPFVHDAIVIRGLVVNVNLGKFSVAVRDVCFASDAAQAGPVNLDPTAETPWSSPTCIHVSLFGEQPTIGCSFTMSSVSGPHF